jgi:hypothetical protein
MEKNYMEGLSDEFILSGEEITDVDNLFTDENEEETQVTPPEKKGNNEKDNNETTEEEEINPDDLFGNPEGVGSEEDN